MRDLTTEEMEAALAMPALVLMAQAIDLEAARGYRAWCHERESWTGATSIIRLAQGEVTMNDERRTAFGAKAEARMADALVGLLEAVAELREEHRTVPT
jgi:hypothetical protein